MDQPKNFAQQTKYPKIYGYCYWGHFHNEIEDKEIIENRNKFVSELNIKTYYIMPSYMVRKHEKLLKREHDYIDHTETYRTHDNKCVIINSPRNVTEEHEKRLLELGYIKYKKMYSTSANTYIYITKIGYREKGEEKNLY